MKKITTCLLGLSLLALQFSIAQKAVSLRGKLFIIGGGDRSAALMRTLVRTAGLKPGDYVVVLPMSSEEPDTSYFYFKEDLAPVCSCSILNFHALKSQTPRRSWLDSLEHAKLVFITGGDQTRFMKEVLNTPVYASIHKAFSNGATIAGTSAGAAVMSRYMITGNELTDTTYRATFRKIHSKNIEITEGLGLLPDAIIDQHFVVRSRYNRLLSAIADHPSLSFIGIDEATAIIVQGTQVHVTGESQVIFLRKPEKLKVTAEGLIKFSNLQVSMYTSGDQFQLTR